MVSLSLAKEERKIRFSTSAGGHLHRPSLAAPWTANNEAFRISIYRHSVPAIGCNAGSASTTDDTPHSSVHGMRARRGALLATYIETRFYSLNACANVISISLFRQRLVSPCCLPSVSLNPVESLNNE